MTQAAEQAEDWSTAKTDPETGIALHGDYPLNSRLRAEALATAGVAEDPDAIVTRELIADAGDRLDRESKAADEAKRNAPSLNWTEKRLREYAATLPNLPAIEADANKAAILAAIEGATAPQQES